MLLFRVMIKGVAMEKEITVIIACMDPRLNERLNEWSGRDDVLILRNAGANVNGLKRSLQSVIDSGIKIKTIISMQHNDCAANKFTKSVINKERPEPSETLMDSLVAQFTDDNLENMDGINHDKQIGNLHGLFDNLHVPVKDGYAIVQIPTPEHSAVQKASAHKHKAHETSSTAPQEHKEHNVVVLVGRCNVSYEHIAETLHKELKSIYIIQALYTKDVYPDIELAKTLFDLKSIIIPKFGTDNELHNDTIKAVSKAFNLDVETVKLTPNGSKSLNKS